MKKERVVQIVILILLAAVNFCTILDFVIIMPMESVFQEMYGFEPSQWGVIISSYTITAGITGFLAAFFLDRFDRKAALLFLFGGFIVGTYLFSLSNSYFTMVLTRSFTGAFAGIINAVLFAIVGDIIPAPRRAAAVGIVTAGFSLASVVGVPIGLVAAMNLGWRVPFQTIVFVSIALFIFLWKYIPSLKEHIEKQSLSPISILKGVWENKNQVKALSLSCLIMFSQFLLIPFIAPYMEYNVGFAQGELVWIYVAGGVASLFAFPLIGLFSDKAGRKPVFTILLFLSLLPIVLLTNLFPVHIIYGLAVTTLFFILVAGRLVPVTAIVLSTSRPEQRGTFMSIRAAVRNLAAGVASIVSGQVLIQYADKHYENYNILGFIAIALSLSTLFLVKRIKELY